MKNGTFIQLFLSSLQEDVAEDESQNVLRPVPPLNTWDSVGFMAHMKIQLAGSS